MAYGNWGAFVYCNGTRREDKEDCVLFEGIKISSWADYCHGVMGDGNIRVKCYKQYSPEIFERLADGTIQEVNYPCEDSLDFDVLFEYKGYKFEFVSGKPCVATMIEPDGTKWECSYDYCYGAGWE